VSDRLQDHLIAHTLATRADQSVGSQEVVRSLERRSAHVENVLIVQHVGLKSS